MKEKVIVKRDLADGEMLESVPIAEINPDVKEEDVIYQDAEKEEPMNVFERQALLSSQAGKKKLEEDKIYKEITEMSDEDLQKAVAEETTDIKDGEGAPLEVYDMEKDAHTINNMMLDSLTDEEAMQIYSVAQKAKADSSFNVVAALPKRLYDNIVLNCRAIGVRGSSAINNYARMLISQLIEEMALNKDCKIFESEMENAMAFPEIVDMYAEHTRNLMEVDMINMAQNSNDETAKKLWLETSKAYTDAYTFERQLKLLEDDAFIRRLEKKIKRFERLCDDFDFVMNKSILKTNSLKSMLDELPYVLKVNEWQCKAFIVMLAEVSKSISADNKPGIWFMYSSMRNIVTLARTGKTKTKFSTECIDHLKNLFSVLEKRYTEVFSV
jgi:hemerythrin superfamily protein